MDELSNWYVRRSRRRFWKGEDDRDKKAAHSTLYECLVTVAKLTAPFTPFVAESLYQNLVADGEAPESVHLADWPEYERGWSTLTSPRGWQRRDAWSGSGGQRATLPP